MELMWNEYFLIGMYQFIGNDRVMRVALLLLMKLVLVKILRQVRVANWTS